MIARLLIQNRNNSLVYQQQSFGYNIAHEVGGLQQELKITLDS
jgi:hypothetical protein